MGKFDLAPCRGITNPDIEHRVRKRGKVRNKAMKKTKVIAKKAKAMESFDGSFCEDLASEESLT
jgi:hypothetical protein